MPWLEDFANPSAHVCRPAQQGSAQSLARASTTIGSRARAAA